MPVAGEQPEQLFSSPDPGSWEFPGSWSPDGEWLTVTARRSGRSADVLLLSATEPREPVAFVATAAEERGALFSPDGRWIAYVSDESGRDEVYVRSFPSSGPAVLMSTDGGREPMWSKGGGELFYRSGTSMMAVEVEQGQEIAPGLPRELFTGRFEPRSYAGEFANYDVSHDGTRFVMVRRRSEVRPNVIQVVLDWPSLLPGSEN